MSRPAPAGLVRLHAQRPSPAAPDQLVDRFIAGGDWLGEPDYTDDGVSFEADLRLRVGPASASVFRKAAIVELGRPVRVEGGLRLPISWRAAGLAPLFPVFAGHLLVTDDLVEIDGYYAPPGGVIGLAADRLLLHMAASRTADWLLEQITGPNTDSAPTQQGARP